MTLRARDAEGTYLFVGDQVATQCQGRPVVGTIVGLGETWATIEHQPTKQRPSLPKAHLIRRRVWKIRRVET